MTTELALNDQLTFEAIAQYTGQQTNVVNDFLPRLVVSRDAETEDGKIIPPGTFKVYSNSQSAVYAKKALLRAYINTYQYQKYDAVNNKFVNQTINFKNWSDEAIDELGGTRCGKASKQQIAKLTEAQVATQKSIKCYRKLFATISMTGVDDDGNEQVIDELPVLWRSTGSAFQPVGDALQILTKAKRASFTHQLDMSLTRAKQGSNVYYIPEIKVDLTKYRAINEGDLELLKKFQETIDFENSQVIEKYKKSKNNEAIADVADDIMDAGFLDLNSTSETFHNDEVPF